jgi:D-alanyl-lipoteichoic acid acyltransferase DltB (MBOAT superfamily)
MAILLEKQNNSSKKKELTFMMCLIVLFPLSLFKYYNFISSQLDLLFTTIGINVGLKGLNWVAPLGLSFYTLQAMGYVLDVYHQRIEAEHDWWDYMLFVSFFPQIASGPISKASELLPQIKKKRVFNETQAVDGLRFLLWGMFLKTVLADRLGLYVDTIFDNYLHQNSISLAVGSILYSFQIYGDFAGYSYMAVGVGKLLGFDLINNFRQPYFAMSITEFWHRWHISLSRWLKDYIYIPLGGSRCSKLRNYFNIFVTFLVSGIWHGANWTFIVWGGIHGLVQVIEKALGLNRLDSHGILRLIRILICFIIVTFAWILFRMPTLEDGINVINGIISMEGSSLESCRLSWKIYMSMALMVVIIKDILDDFYKTDNMLLSFSPVVLRWCVYVILLAMILLFGVLNSATFIYANF